MTQILDDIGVWTTRATYVARAGSLVSVVGEYAARITSKDA